MTVANKAGRPVTKNKITQCQMPYCKRPSRTRVAPEVHKRTTNKPLWVCKPCYEELRRKANKASNIGQCSYTNEDYRCRSPRRTNCNTTKHPVGYCRRHEGFYLDGKHEAVQDSLKKLAQRIEPDHQTGCWIINTPDNKRATLDAVGRSKWLASRFMWLAFTSPTTDTHGRPQWGHHATEELAHVCPHGENALCVNPTHLTPLTSKQNEEMKRKPDSQTTLEHITKAQQTKPSAELIEWATRHKLPLSATTGKDYQQPVTTLD